MKSLVDIARELKPELEARTHHNAQFASNAVNRSFTRTALGLEVYEAMPDGSHRYLSPSEVMATLSFEQGQFIVTPSDTRETIASKLRTSYPALTRYVGANMVHQ
jgi:hypothetical protein